AAPVAPEYAGSCPGASRAIIPVPRGDIFAERETRVLRAGAAASLMELSANQYLDARDRRWTAAEQIGAVRYDPITRTVTVHDPDIRRTMRARTGSCRT